MNRAHGTALAILVLLVFAIHATLAGRIAAIRSDARSINEAGLERMRVQRAALLAVRLAAPPAADRPALRAALNREAQRIWHAWQTLPALRTGGVRRHGALTAQVRQFVGWSLAVAVRPTGAADASVVGAEHEHDI